MREGGGHPPRDSGTLPQKPKVPQGKRGWEKKIETRKKMGFAPPDLILLGKGLGESKAGGEGEISTMQTETKRGKSFAGQILRKGLVEWGPQGKRGTGKKK